MLVTWEDPYTSHYSPALLMGCYLALDHYFFEPTTTLRLALPQNLWDVPGSSGLHISLKEILNLARDFGAPREEISDLWYFLQDEHLSALEVWRDVAILLGKSIKVTGLDKSEWEGGVLTFPPS